MLETLSLLPAARGRGLGTRLVELLDEDARRYGATRGIVDVVTGNTPALGFYANAGFEPYSETWIRSEDPGPRLEVPGRLESGPPAGIAGRAARLGLEFDIAPGPDDTWVTSERMADLGLLDAREADAGSGSGPGSGPGVPLGRGAQGSQGEAARPDLAALRDLVTDLEASGLWSIQVTIPAAPESGPWREALASLGFRSAMERFTRPL